MPALKTQAALAAALAAAAAAWCARLARRRGCTLSEWVGVHAGIASLAVKHETEAQEAVPLGPRRRLRRFRQLAFLLAIERNRRFEVAEAAKCADPDAIYKLHPLQHVKTQGQLTAAQQRADAETMMKLKMLAESSPQVTDLVLVGGGHAHVHVLRMLGMAPMAGVRLTLIARDVETPYSGMLPGHVAGSYARRECHIDLNVLARFAGARLIEASATHIDMDKNMIVLEGGSRPPVPFDVLSVNVGISPTGLAHAGAGAQSECGVTPVKPIGAFSERWDALLAKLDFWEKDEVYDIVVVGGGGGGVELVLAIATRVRAELLNRGKDPSLARFSLLTRGRQLMGGHSPGVRRLIAEQLAGRGIFVRLGCEAVGVVEGQKVLRCKVHGGEELVPFAECVWCTSAAAPAWLGRSGLRTDEDGFLLVDTELRCLGHRNVLAAGDCCAVVGHPRPKAGVFAVMAGMDLYTNIVAELTGADSVTHIPQSDFLGLFGCGDETAVASRGDLALHAKWLWDLKDWIDRKWMWQYTSGLPSMETEAALAPPAFTKRGQVALDLLQSAPMRCGGCGAKVGSTSLERALKKLPPALTSQTCNVVLGVDAPDDGAVVEYKGATLVHTVDFFRSFVGDPYVFGQIAANHALSDCDAMGATAATALALVVLPYGGERQVEDALFQLMSGARKALDAAGCVLVGGHTCEGAELALGFAINGVASDDKFLSKEGLRAGDVLLLTKPLGTGVLFAGDMRAMARAADVREALASMCLSNSKAAAVLRAHNCTACTDVTGFGLMGHLVEMCRAARGASATVSLAAVPRFGGASDLARQGVFSSLQGENARARRAVRNHEEASQQFGVDYALLYDPQTAGGLLASVPAVCADACVLALKEAGYEATAVIGHVDAVGCAASFPAAVTVVA